MSEAGWFAGNHGPEGVWKSEKGGMLAPHIAQPMTSTNMGEARFNGTTPTTHSTTSNIIVSTGMTGGGGTMAR